MHRHPLQRPAARPGHLGRGGPSMRSTTSKRAGVFWSHQGFQPICVLGFHALDIVFDWHTTYPPDRVMASSMPSSRSGQDHSTRTRAARGRPRPGHRRDHGHLQRRGGRWPGRAEQEAALRQPLPEGQAALAEVLYERVFGPLTAATMRRWTPMSSSRQTASGCRYQSTAVKLFRELVAHEVDAPVWMTMSISVSTTRTPLSAVKVPSCASAERAPFARRAREKSSFT